MLICTVGLSAKMGLCQPSVNIRSLAAAVLAHALTDLLRGRDAAGVLSCIEGRPAALPFWMACHWLDISARNTPVRLRAMAANPARLPGSP